MRPSLLIIPANETPGVLMPQIPFNGTADFTVSRTTTPANNSTRVNSSGLIEIVNDNVPRIDYLNQSCPALLVEPSATNLVPSGLVFNAAAGVLYDTAVSDSPAVSINSARITKNEASGNIQYASQTCSTSALSGSTTYTISRFFKYDGYAFATSMEYNNATQWGGTSWNQVINIASSGVTLGMSSSCTGSIENYGNGWYRVAVRITTGASPSGSPVTYLMRLPAALSTGQGFLTALPQLETGSVATTYIPTTTAAVSRAADTISASGALVSGYIGQTEGTIYAEVDLKNFEQNARIIALSDGTTSNRITLIFNTASRFRLLVNVSTSGQVDLSSSAQVSGIYKVAVAYKENDYAFYLNGTQIGTDTSALVPACTSVFLGKIESSASTNFLNDRIRAAAIYTSRLSNDNLMLLTLPTNDGYLPTSIWNYYLSKPGVSEVSDCLYERYFNILNI